VLDHICWKYGFLHFRNEPLPAVIERLHRYYNIDFEYDLQKIKHITVSGKLDLKDSVYKVFSTVALTAGVKYKIMENKILINND